MKEIVEHYFKSNELSIDHSLYEIIEQGNDSHEEMSDGINRLVETSIQEYKGAIV